MLLGSKITVARPKCSKPASLYNFSILDLAQDDFKCNNPAPQQVSCAVQNQCPRGCSCTRDRVNCASLGLRAIPNDIPKTTRWLELQDNKIDNLTPIRYVFLYCVTHSTY